MSKFLYDIPTKVFFGEGIVSGGLGKTLKAFGNKVLLVYGCGSIKAMSLYDTVIAEIASAEMEVFELSGVQPNPRIESVRLGADICKREKIDVVLAVGGGSVIDAAKVIAAGALADCDAWKLVTGEEKITACLPIVSILTLSATGSEMDTFAVISNLETHEKIGTQSKYMRPKVSFLDPSYTYSVNAFQTAAGSVDIMSHIIEAYFAPKNDLYMLDTQMEGLLKTVIKYTPEAIKNPNDFESRANLMWASSWAINGFISGGKRHEWSCHPMEHELSAFYDITHGLGLAILTPRWLEYCLNESNVYKYYQFGVNVFDIDKRLPSRIVAERSIKMLSDFFFETCGLVSRLSSIGIDNKNFEIMARKACRGGILSGFVPLCEKDIVKIYEMSL